MGTALTTLYSCITGIFRKKPRKGMTRIFRGLFLMVKMKVEKNTLALLRFSEVSPGRKALIFSDGSPL